VLPHSRLRFEVMMYGYWNAVRPSALATNAFIDVIRPVSHF
jgi:hypothetical protein